MALDIATLESSLENWSVAGYFATGIVAIGCFGESIVEFTTWLKPRSLSKKIGGLSAVVLVLGLACEVITQVKVNAISGQIIAFFNNETAQARLEVVRLNARRRLNPSQSRDLISALRSYQDREFWVTVERADQDISSEQSMFGAQMATIFEAAGWHRNNHVTTNDPNKAEQEVGPVSDWGCNLAFNPVSQPIADIIESHLRTSGINCDQHSWPDLKADAIVFEVGLR